MDLSKLPRLSNTPPGPPDDPAPPPISPPTDPYPPATYAVEAWLSIGVGIIVLLIFPTMLQYASSLVLHTHFAPYDAYDLAGNAIYDASGKPARSDVVTWFANGSYIQIPYRRTSPEVNPNFWSDLVVTAFALALILEGIALALSRRPAVVGSALAVTTAATIANLVFFIASYAHYNTFAIMSAIATLIGGYMVIGQWQLLRYALAPAPPPRARGSLAARAVVSEALGRQPGPRCAHYRFAHEALRRAALDAPTRCLGLLQSPEGNGFLANLWDAVNAGCAADSGPGGVVAPTGLSAHTTQVGPYSAVVVAMPRAEQPGEAHFVGIVVRSFVRESDGVTIERRPLLLYFTLEQSDSGRPILARWEAGAHLNFGPLAGGDLAEFRSAMSQKVADLDRREDVGAA